MVDPLYHRYMRRNVASSFTLTSVLPMEPIMDRNNALLKDHLMQMAKSGEVIDLNHSYHCWAYDIVGEITVRSNPSLPRDDHTYTRRRVKDSAS
jgi:hypothetical protein